MLCHLPAIYDLLDVSQLPSTALPVVAAILRNAELSERVAWLPEF